MNNLVLGNIFRFVGLFLVQVLVFKQVSEAIGPWFSIFIYPLFILLLPLVLPTSLVVLAGFFMGILIDMFYQSPGVHASAGAFSGFGRALIFAIFEPKGGFSSNYTTISPLTTGWQTFMQIAGVFFFAHLFWYFAVSEFTLVYFGSITLKTLGALVLSLLMVVIYLGLFRTK